MTAERVDQQNTDITRSDIFSSIVSEAGSFYRTIITVASTFLGGTLLFLERIAPRPSIHSVIVLAIGWFCLIAAILFIIFVRALNLRSGQYALEGRFDKAHKLDTRKWALTVCAAWALTLGLLCIMWFGFVNLMNADMSASEKGLDDEPARRSQDGASS